MDNIAVWVYRHIKLPNAILQVMHFTLWHGNIVAGILLANLRQLWVLLNPQHLVKHLKSLVLRLRRLESLVFQLLSFLRILHP